MTAPEVGPASGNTLSSTRTTKGWFFMPQPILTPRGGNSRGTHGGRVGRRVR